MSTARTKPLVPLAAGLAGGTATAVAGAGRAVPLISWDILSSSRKSSGFIATEMTAAQTSGFVHKSRTTRQPQLSSTFICRTAPRPRGAQPIRERS